MKAVKRLKVHFLTLKMLSEPLVSQRTNDTKKVASAKRKVDPGSRESVQKPYPDPNGLTLYPISDQNE